MSRLPADTARASLSAWNFSGGRPFTFASPIGGTGLPDGLWSIFAKGCVPPPLHAASMRATSATSVKLHHLSGCDATTTRITSANDHRKRVFRQWFRLVTGDDVRSPQTKGVAGVAVHQNHMGEKHLIYGK